MNRQYFRGREPEATIMVRTWCRVCGDSTLVGVPTDYERAVEAVHWIDDQVMDHGAHGSAGGWGIHWRLDDVLKAAFPTTHWEELFPVPKWYPHRVDTMELPVLRVIQRNGVDRIL